VYTHIHTQIIRYVQKSAKCINGKRSKQQQSEYTKHLLITNKSNPLSPID